MLRSVSSGLDTSVIMSLKQIYDKTMGWLSPNVKSVHLCGEYRRQVDCLFLFIKNHREAKHGSNKDNLYTALHIEQETSHLDQVPACE